MKKQFLFIVIALVSFTQLNAQEQFAMVSSSEVNSGVKKGSLTKADILDYRAEEQKIIKKIQKLQIYPDRAIEYNIEGKVVLAVKFNGTIKSVEVEKSGGELLDRAALKAVKEYEKHYQSQGNKRMKTTTIYIPFLFEL